MTTASSVNGWTIREQSIPSKQPTRKDTCVCWEDEEPTHSENKGKLKCPLLKGGPVFRVNIKQYRAEPSVQYMCSLF